MATIIGNVRCVQVSDDTAWATIDDINTGRGETLILWWLPGTGGGYPSMLTSYTRIMHSMWISQLRTAMANNLTVSIITPSNNSGLVSTVRLGQF